MNRKQISENHVSNLVQNGQVNNVTLSSFKSKSLVNQVSSINRNTITNKGGNNQKDIKMNS